MSPGSSRYFTLDEANEALDAIRPLMDEIQKIRERILSQRSDLWPAVERSAGNGGSPALSRQLESFDRLDLLMHKIQDAGVILKDLNMGLVDFPCLRGHEEVYLCWKHGETSVQFWHEVEAGFQGRHPIADF